MCFALPLNLIPPPRWLQLTLPMEKSVAATNEKVSNDIPDDLAFSILSKLPLKSLKRFGCVSKSWALLFENPHFMNMYRSNFISKDDTSTLLLQQSIVPVPHTELYLLSGERFENRVKLDLPPPFQDDGNWTHILSYFSVNGILCLSERTRVVLWNPAIKEFKVIRPSPAESVPPYREPFFILQGFGYDHVRDDYKVIRRTNFLPLTDHDYFRFGVPPDWVDMGDTSYDSVCEIYSLRSKSWRKLDVEMPCCDYDMPATRVYMDGVCHWWSHDEKGNVVACLVSFDLGNEVFFTTPMPSYMDDDSLHFRFRLVHLAVLKGSISLISSHTDITTFHISILGELGVKESWTKLFIVGPLPCVEHPIHLIGVGKKGNIFFKKKNHELYWFDLSTQMIEELGLKGHQYDDCQVVINCFS